MAKVAEREELGSCELAESESRFRAIFDQRAQLSGILTPDGILLDANQTALDFSGVTREEVVGRPFWEAKWWSHAPELQERLREAVEGAARGEFVQFDADHPRPDGTMATVEFSLRPVFDQAGEIAMLVPESRDVTAIRETERQLRESESLARIGKMAAALAHDIRNPLAAISGGLELLRAKFTPDGDEWKLAELILERVDEMNDSLEGLLAYARPKRPELGSVPIRASLERLVALFLRNPELEGLRIDLEGDEVLVRCDLHQVESAILNLLTNAAQSMASVGRIRIAIERSEEQCRVAVEDGGPGIPDDVLPKVFEPFMTTKPRGTGLGLPTVKQIIESHGGRVVVVCPPEGGTNVSVSLPLADD